MDIYLIRHTKTDVAKGLCFGQRDIELADSFTDEAAELREKLPQLTDSFHVFSSPLSRCMQLAQFLSKPITIDERLLELNFGDWEGVRFDDIEPDVLRYWTDNFVQTSPPNGESFEDLCQRAGGFWQDLIRMDIEQVLVVTHAGTIRALLAHILGLPLANAFQLRINFGSVHKLQHHDGYTYIDYLNQ